MIILRSDITRRIITPQSSAVNTHTNDDLRYLPLNVIHSQQRKPHDQNLTPHDEPLHIDTETLYCIDMDANIN